MVETYVGRAPWRDPDQGRWRMMPVTKVSFSHDWHVFYVVPSVEGPRVSCGTLAEQWAAYHQAVSKDGAALGV